MISHLQSSDNFGEKKNSRDIGTKMFHLFWISSIYLHFDFVLHSIDLRDMCPDEMRTIFAE